ncbi:MAG: hypothetical protein WBP12_00020 [Candidatus Saccharimonas sp.]
MTLVWYGNVVGVTRAEGDKMYILGLREPLSVEVQVLSIENVPHERYNPYYNVRVRVRFTPFSDTEVTLVLWVDPDRVQHIHPEDGFVRREVILEGFGPSDPDNPYEKGSVRLKAIWFDDPDGVMTKKQSLQVLHEDFES